MNRRACQDGSNFEVLFLECLSKLTYKEITAFADYICRTFRKSHFTLYQLLLQQQAYPLNLEHFSEGEQECIPFDTSYENSCRKRKKLVSKGVQTVITGSIGMLKRKPLWEDFRRRVIPKRIPIDNSLVQIQADNREVQRHLYAYWEHAQAENDKINDREFRDLRSDSSARTSTAQIQRDFQIRISRATPEIPAHSSTLNFMETTVSSLSNVHSSMSIAKSSSASSSSTSYFGPCSSSRGTIVNEALEERLGTLERFLNIAPVPKEIHMRLRTLEDRVLALEERLDITAEPRNPPETFYKEESHKISLPVSESIPENHISSLSNFHRRQRPPGSRKYHWMRRFFRNGNDSGCNLGILSKETSISLSSESLVNRESPTSIDIANNNNKRDSDDSLTSCCSKSEFTHLPSVVEPLPAPDALSTRIEQLKRQILLKNQSLLSMKKTQIQEQPLSMNSQ